MKEKDKDRKDKTAVPVRRKNNAFEKISDIGLTGVVNSIKDEVFNCFPGVLTLASEPRVNIRETDREFIIKAAVPGMDKEDIDIEANKDSVKISGSYREEEDDKGGSWLKIEKKYGSFSRAFKLPAGIDATKAKAGCEKGLLTIELPKKALSSGKTIEIK